MIHTERLDLLPFNLLQLRLYLENPQQLETELGFPISRAIVTDVVQRAIGMKLAKMAQADPTKLDWYTYWLIVVRGLPFGAGLIGFKGVPDNNGEVEIGYGIDPAFQGKGYTTEAARAMIQWAFTAPDCQAVIAPHTKRSNLASQHVLLNCGMHLYGEDADSLNFKVEKNQSERL
jgi:RimJ/RimL family protein N-acetyltransferase